MQHTAIFMIQQMQSGDKNRMMKKFSNTILGFTLIELLITVSLSCIVITLASPAFVKTYHSWKKRHFITELSQLLHFARTQALLSQTTVTICHSANGNSCEGKWPDGILVFSDKNANYQQDGNDQLLFHWNSIPPNSILSWKSFLSKNAIQFTPDGFCFTHNGSFIYFASEKDTSPATLTINRQGRIRVK